MAKGYWVATVDVNDPERYKRYIAANGAVFAAHGARFLVRGGRSAVVEGRARARMVVIEFADYDTALACWNSPEYAAVRALRTDCSIGDVVVVEGWDGPAPTGA